MKLTRDADPACAAKLPPVGVVTREHRIAALESRFEGCRYYDLHCGVGYAETGDMRGILPEVSRAAQAIADAEARGAAAKPPAGVEATEALDALNSIVIHHMREDKWEASGRDLVNTIRSALELRK